MKILILALLVLGVAARPERRRPGQHNRRPAHPPFGPPPLPGGERPPFKPDQDGPMGGDGFYPVPAGGPGGDEEWIPPFDEIDGPAPADYGWGMEDDKPMRPPCPAGGDRDNDLGPFGPDSGFERPPGKPDQDGRGDRYPRMSPPIGEEGAEPGSGRPERPQRRGQGGRRERPERPQRGGGRRERPQRPQRPEGERRRNPGRRPNRGPFGGTTPSAVHQGQRQFFPIFKSENITLENTTDLGLHEGDNTFILPKAGRRRGAKKGEQNAPLEQFGYGGYAYRGFLPYLTLKYNPTATPTVSFEYGITQFFPGA